MMEGSSCDSGGERGKVATAEEQASRGGRGDEREQTRRGDGSQVQT
jgi:hypothetical protein